MNTNWTDVTSFFNSVIEEADTPILDETNRLEITVYSPALDRTLAVEIPPSRVSDFMKNLPLFRAHTYDTKQFCGECGGPYRDWPGTQYNGHWDTCPNRRDSN